MTRIWSLSRSRFSLGSFVLVFLISTFLTPISNASRGGVEDRTNKFAVGFTYSDAGVPSVCSGILIQPKIIATARHCIRNDAGVSGTKYVFSNPGQPIDGPGTAAKVSRVIISDEDLAFIILDIALTGASYLRIADQATIDGLAEGSLLSGHGYGAVYETNSPYSSLVKEYSIDWNSLGRVPNLKNTFELTSKVASACRGDSGGPITSVLRNGEEVLVAVMSGAANVEKACGNPGADGLYRMRVILVSPYLNLIPEYAFPVVAPTPTPKPSPKIIKITCIKGKLKKVVSGTNPKCPKGYTLKK